MYKLTKSKKLKLNRPQIIIRADGEYVTTIRVVLGEQKLDICISQNWEWEPEVVINIH